jgi:hypothetical protein
MTTHSPNKPTVSPAVRQWLDNHQPCLMINNEFVEAKSGKTFESINPATEQVVALAAQADKADVDEAVKAARTAVEEGPLEDHSQSGRSAGSAQ